MIVIRKPCIQTLCIVWMLLTGGLSDGLCSAQAQEPYEIGSRRELFADRFLIERLDKAELRLQTPRDAGPVLMYDKPWEGAFCGYVTILRDGDKFRAYYRGLPKAGKDGSTAEVCCVAESADGKSWTKPELGLYEVHGTTRNNVVLAQSAPVTHNFSPFLDTRPGVAPAEKYKALGGTMGSGLIAYRSIDGLRWERMRESAVIPVAMVPYKYMFDSQNVPFWSEVERKYVCYFRVFENNIRRIARSTSDDFLTWTPPVLMGYHHADGQTPIEHLYTNQTHPYFRAPQLYVSIAARFMPGQRVLTDEQAKQIGVDPGYFRDTSDAVFQTTRPVIDDAHAATYDRTFLEGFIRGGIGPQNWVSRTNYPAQNIVQTGPHEMSLYVNQDYAQPTAHLRRYSLRLDGFAALHAGYHGGEMVTRPLTFTGTQLSLNFATSAAGSVRVELQTATGEPISGFTAADCQPQIGNEIERIVTWKAVTDLSPLAGQPIRMRWILKDADVFSFQFQP